MGDFDSQTMGMNGNNEQPVSQVWTRSWNIDELRGAIDSWSLASDAGLYYHLYEKAKSTIERTMGTRKAIENLRLSYKDVHVEAENGMNTLDMLSNLQFLENLVADDTEELSNMSTPANNVADRNPEDVVSIMRQALQLGMNVLKDQYERIDVTQSARGTISDEYANGTMNPNDDLNSIASLPLTFVEPLFQAKDPYERRHLPHLIGSRAFVEDDSLGIGFLDDEEEVLTDPEEEEEEEPPLPTTSNGAVYSDRSTIEDDVSSHSEAEPEPNQIIRNTNTSILTSTSNVGPPPMTSITRPGTMQRDSRPADMFASDEDSDDDNDIWNVPSNRNTTSSTTTAAAITVIESTNPDTLIASTSESSAFRTPQDLLAAELTKRLSVNKRTVDSDDDDDEDEDTNKSQTDFNRKESSASTTSRVKTEPVSAAARTLPTTRAAPATVAEDDDEEDWLLTKPTNKAATLSKPPITTTTTTATSSTLKPEAANKASIFSDDEDEDDIFSTATKKPANVKTVESKPVAASILTTAPVVTSTLAPTPTPVTSSAQPSTAVKSSAAPSKAKAIWSDDDDDDEDLFGGFNATKTSTLPPPKKPLATTATSGATAKAATMDVKRVIPTTSALTKKPQAMTFDDDDDDDEDLFNNLLSNKKPIETNTKTQAPVVATPPPAAPTQSIPPTTVVNDTQPVQVKPTTTIAPKKADSLLSNSDSDDEDLFLTKQSKKSILPSNQSSTDTPPPPTTITKPNSNQSTTVPTVPTAAIAVAPTATNRGKDSKNYFDDEEDEDLFSSGAVKQKAPPIQPVSKESPKFVEPIKSKIVTTTNLLPTTTTTATSITSEDDDEDLFRTSSKAIVKPTTNFQSQQSSSSTTSDVQRPASPTKTDEVPIRTSIQKAPIGGISLFPGSAGGRKSGAFKDELESKMRLRGSVHVGNEPELVKTAENSTEYRPPNVGLDDFFGTTDVNVVRTSTKLESRGEELDFGAPPDTSTMLDSVLMSRAVMSKPTRRRPSNLISSAAKHKSALESLAPSQSISTTTNTTSTSSSSSSSTVKNITEVKTNPTPVAPVKIQEEIISKPVDLPLVVEEEQVKKPQPKESVTPVKASSTRTTTLEDDIFADIPTVTSKPKRTTSTKSSTGNKAKSNTAAASGSGAGNKKKTGGSGPPPLNVDDIDDIFAVDTSKKSSSKSSSTNKKTRVGSKKAPAGKGSAILEDLKEGDDDPLGALK